MTPNLLSLFAASFACIALLASFAIHNRKMGWVKKRSTLVEEIIALRDSWETMDRKAPAPFEEAAPSLLEITPETSALFSSQLAQLQVSLQKTAGKQVEVDQLVSR
jgi:hypothetical protein